MAAAMITAAVDDPCTTSDNLKNLLTARDIALRGDLDLHLTFDLTSYDEVQMEAEGEEEDVIAFLAHCREEGVRIKAVREDDETHFRLV